MTRKIPIKHDNYSEFNVRTLELARAPTHEEIENQGKEIWGLVTTLEDKITRDLIDRLPQLSIITQFAVGVNNIDLDYCRHKNIKVCNTPDVLTEATAELTFALMLGACRLIKPAIDNARDGNWVGWEPMGFLGRQLKNKTLGIVGAGRIGQRFAEMANAAFNMKIIYHNRKRNNEFESKIGAEYKNLDEVLKNSDVLSLLCPLTIKTRNLLTYERMKSMKKEAILINTARGEIIDQNALMNVLKEGHLFSVGLDVTSPEPLAMTHELYQFDNVLITPHIGSATIEARREMAQMCFENLRRKNSGEKLLSEVL